jgi:hypothetical protein
MILALKFNGGKNSIKQCDFVEIRYLFLCEDGHPPCETVRLAVNKSKIVMTETKVGLIGNRYVLHQRTREEVQIEDVLFNVKVGK